MDRDTQIIFDHIAIEIRKKYEERYAEALEEAELAILEEDTPPPRGFGFGQRNTLKSKKSMISNSRARKFKLQNKEAILKYERQKEQRIDSFNKRMKETKHQMKTISEGYEKEYFERKKPRSPQNHEQREAVG